MPLAPYGSLAPRFRLGAVAPLLTSFEPYGGNHGQPCSLPHRLARAAISSVFVFRSPSRHLLETVTPEGRLWALVPFGRYSRYFLQLLEVSCPLMTATVAPCLCRRRLRREMRFVALCPSPSPSTTPRWSGHSDQEYLRTPQAQWIAGDVGFEEVMLPVVCARSPSCKCAHTHGVGWFKIGLESLGVARADVLRAACSFTVPTHTQLITYPPPLCVGWRP